MIAERFSQDLPKPLPQVGAVLRFDSEISPPDFRGGKHWKLAGSCVLLSQNRCLTIGHILGGRWERIAASRHAVFFPYEGFFALSGSPLEWEDKQTPGDNLALVDLARPVDHWPPLRHLRIRGVYRKTGSAFVCGYGCWPGSPFGRLEGLQQQHLVHLGPPHDVPPQKVPGWRRYDRIDMSWSSMANRLHTAGRGNSGGPFLWQDNGSLFVVAITREVQRDQQVGSWIGNDRTRWLDHELNGQLQAAGHPWTAPLSTAWELLSFGAREGKLIRLPVPPGATLAKATLNACQGVRLQMEVVPEAQDDSLLDRVKGNDEASGQFLDRTCKLPEKTQEISIGVAAVARAQARSERVFAQLCVLFA
jgi:hypothetical protein